MIIMKMLAVFAIGLLLSGCATLAPRPARMTLESMRLDDAFIKKEWAEVESIYGIKAKLVPIKIMKIDLSGDDNYLGTYFDNDRIEIYSMAFDGYHDDLSNELFESVVYNTISHELIHYALDVSWGFKNPPDRADDHCVMTDALKKLCDLNAEHFGDKDRVAEKITLDNLLGEQEKECHE